MPYFLKQLHVFGTTVLAFFSKIIDFDDLEKKNCMHSEDRCSSPEEKQLNVFLGRTAENPKGPSDLVPKKEKICGDRKMGVKILTLVDKRSKEFLICIKKMLSRAKRGRRASKLSGIGLEKRKMDKKQRRRQPCFLYPPPPIFLSQISSNVSFFEENFTNFLLFIEIFFLSEISMHDKPSELEALRCMYTFEVNRISFKTLRRNSLILFKL